MDSWHGNNLLYTKRFGICFATISATLTIVQGTWTTIETLPIGYRPAFTVVNTMVFGGNANVNGLIRVNANGTVDVFCANAGGTLALWGGISFPIEW